MSAEFLGISDVLPVLNDPDDNMCFPAIVASLTGSYIDVALETSFAARLSNEDGSTSPFLGKKILRAAGSFATFEKLSEPEKEDIEDYLTLFDREFVSHHGIALYHKKDAKPTDPGEGQQHWVLLNGTYWLDDATELGPIHALDPDHRKANPEDDDFIHISRKQLAAMITQSLDYANGGVGIFAYAVSIGRDSPSQSE